MQLRSTLTAIAVVCPALAAQAYFSPAAAASGNGNVNNTLPFAQATAQYQQVHSLSSFSSQTATIFTRMRFRAKAATTGGSADLELFMANSPNDAFNASQTFASNETPASLVNVFTRKIVNLPNVGANVWGAPDFAFDTPFPYLGAQHVSWRVVIHTNTSTPYTLDCYSDWRFGTNTPYAGCQHPQGTQTSKHNSTFRSPGQPWDLNGYSYLPNVPLPGAVLIGDNAGSWGGIPLPFDMGAIGAPTCQLVNNIVFTIGGTSGANATGFLGIKMPTPQDNNLIGAVIYTQFVFLDPNANALGAFTSQGKINTSIPAPVGIRIGSPDIAVGAPALVPRRPAAGGTPRAGHEAT
ncbi:MAG: hypothetical protein IT458_16350 [Planctomycetes bacterium]|nr:hypothetical protein [Planctomycetota bacterium]